MLQEVHTIIYYDFLKKFDKKLEKNLTNKLYDPHYLKEVIVYDYLIIFDAFVEIFDVDFL